MAARRKADQLIVDGRVAVNGVLAHAGQQVDPESDRVTLDGTLLRLPSEHTYVMMNKAPGVLTSVGDPRGRPTVTDRLDTTQRLFPVGRLDQESRGLLLLTDDGELAMRLMHPRYEVQKEYHVLITGTPSGAALERLAEGVVVGAERFQPAEATVLGSEGDRTRLSMVLREGRKREVRRIWQALGHRVLDLQRVRVDGIRLGSLKEGATRALTAEEVARLRAAVF